MYDPGNRTYINSAAELETSIDDLNKMLNPSIRYYPAEDQDQNSVPSAQEKSAAGDVEKKQRKPGLRLDFSNESLLNGIILAEVLGRPKYFRKGRW